MRTRRSPHELLDWLDRLVSRTRMGKIRPSETDRPMVTALEEILLTLDWSRRELARQVGVSPSLVTRWLAPLNESRDAPETGHSGGSVAARHVSRIAWAVAGALDRPTGAASSASAPAATEDTYAARDRTAFIANALHYCAGLESRVRLRDVVWDTFFSEPRQEAIQSVHLDRKLRVGIVSWQPARDVGWTQFAKSVTRRVLALLGKRPDAYEFVPIHFSQLGANIRARNIHMVAPMLIRAPFRSGAFRLSNPLERVWVQMDGLAITRDLQPWLPDSESDRTPLTERDLVISATSGEVSESMASLHFPAADFDAIRRGTDPAEYVHGLLESAPSRGAPGGVRLVLSNAVSCGSIVKRWPRQLTSLRALQARGSVLKVEPPMQAAIDSYLELALPLSFAVHPREKKLCEEINRALEVLVDIEMYQDLVAGFAERAGRHQVFQFELKKPRSDEAQGPDE